MSVKPYITELANTDPIQAFSSVHALPYSLLLDSAHLEHANARYSFIACYPSETIEAKNNIVTITSREGQDRFEGDPFAVLQQRIKAFEDKTETILGLPPFQGGAAGFFGYDLGRSIENLPEAAEDQPDMPNMAVGIYDQVLAYDHLKQQAWLITHAENDRDAEVKKQIILRALENKAPQEPHIPVELPWETSFDTFEYRQHISKVIEYIRAGDIFQANIAQRFDAELPLGFDSYAHYLRLREVNPAPFASYFNIGDVRISSASPERFLTLKERTVETRPIKGTRPHVGDPAIDRLYRNSLENSEKDRAENTMIVDLLRNDLSKVCDAHSIEVDELCKLETFATVHHLVSTIKGTLKDDQGAVDLLRACFPGGSITGAPKIRAMEVIEEIEPKRRGPYCGAMGYIGFDGAMDSAILIRTLVYQGDTVSLQSGSGIVADSDPDEEYQETFDKADAIFRSFNDYSYEIEEDYLAAMAGVVGAE